MKPDSTRPKAARPRKPAATSAAHTAQARTPRPGGQATRQHLLETAGQLFAERGFAEGTTKEIAERAGTPMASINYHFGSREGLYEAVLIEAHRQILSIDELQAVSMEANVAPREKLRMLIAHVMGVSARRETPWGFRVMVREALSPSAVFPSLVEKAVLPKAMVMRGLIGEVMGLPQDHPAVQRAVAFVVLPTIMLLVAPRAGPERLLPALLQDPAALQEDLVRYVMAGLAALTEAHRREAAAASQSEGKKPASRAKARRA